MNAKATTAPFQNPIPIVIPSQAHTQSPAAVVNPRTWLRPVTIIVPAPRKPIPLMIWAPILAISPVLCKDTRMYSLVSITRAEPMHTSACVLTPAPRPLLLRSTPTRAPINVANASRRTMDRSVSSEAISTTVFPICIPLSCISKINP